MDEFGTDSLLNVTPQSKLRAYAKYLEATSTNVEILNALKTLKFQKFLDLCKFHLSLAVDLPPEFNEYHSSRSLIAGHRKFRPLIAGLNVCRGESSDVYDAVISLMDYLSAENLLLTPLIFRKTGNIGRQRDFNKLLLNGGIPSYPFYSKNLNGSSLSILSTPGSIKRSWSRMTRSKISKNTVNISEVSTDNIKELNAHDYANILKAVLREMPNPILTKNLLPIYISVSKITSGNCDGCGNRIPLSPGNSKLARAKQLSAIRTLTWLLPIKNQNLLRRLLDLLTETLTYSQINQMSADSLGTIFGPLLFVPSCRSHDDLHKDYDSLNSLATVMIEQGSDGIFSVPLALLNDVKRNLIAESAFRSMCISKDYGLEIYSTEDEEELDDMAIFTNVGFAERCGSVDAESWKQPTKDAMKELSAVLGKLPDTHPKKAYYLRSIAQLYGLNESENTSVNATSSKGSVGRSLVKLPGGKSQTPVLSTGLNENQVTCCALRSMLSLPKKKRLEIVKGGKIESLLKEAMICHPESKKKAFAMAKENNSYLLQLPVRRNYDNRKLDKHQLTSITHNPNRHGHFL